MTEDKQVSENRLISLDVFRGITIAGMVLVNNPGTWGAIYPPLKHAEWNGATPTDFVFPFFLFIVGVAITLALGKRVEQGGAKKEIYYKIISRAAVIFFLGLFMAAFPLFDYAKSDVPTFIKIAAMFALAAVAYFWLIGKSIVSLILLGTLIIFSAIFYFAGYTLNPLNFETLRIPGVLQRIAVCYLIAGLIFLHTDWKRQAIIAGALLLIYWALMTLINIPGCEVTTFNDKACNLSAYLDRVILTENHIWRSSKVYDPEGILSTIPAIATTLAGVLCGHWLRRKIDDNEKVAAMFCFGICLTVIGWIWNFWFPINKPLWTSSYVVYTAGLALCFLGFCYWLIDIKGYKAWTKPFVIFGVNALALFVGSGILAKSLGLIKISVSEEKTISLQQAIFQNVFLPIASPINASLMYAVTFILFWLFLMWLLYRKRIYIKV
jgi:predicted acyltransferase